jgi:Tc toxin complex TcA C-terminal TcB-binding domain
VLYARLKNRFHQEFETHDTTAQPANRLLISILTKILTAPVGSGYGFAIAAGAIAAQGEMSDREYLDSLIALSGESLPEIEKRYRLNLHRSDIEMSNPVQQNIDTLQRFLTDSYQSIDDPFPATPDRIAGTSELLIINFPDEGAGPFFLEYEEWLAREEPFYPENFFDPRATYKWTILEGLQKTHDILFARSMSVAAFLDLGKGEKAKFDPSSGAYDHAATKWQWVRNHVEVSELIDAANKDAAAINYPAAEDKYKTALDWVTKLRSFATNADAAWQYNPAAFAKAQKNADVSTIEKLDDFERTYHRYFGQHWDSGLMTVASDLLPGGTEISDQWWGKPEKPFEWPGNRRELRYLLDYLQYRYLPACLSEVQLAIGKYADAVRQLIGPTRFNVFAADPKADVFPVLTVAGRFQHFTDGSLPYATSSDRSKIPNPLSPTLAPSNRAEIGYFKLKLGNATLEWADALYRTNQPDSIMRARELYKGVLFLHGEDPEITPTWPRRDQRPLPFPLPWIKGSRNPAVESQVNRARLGFMQINAALNYYGASPAMVPPVRYRVLKEAADRFAAGARGAQSDFLNYMQQLDALTVSEMTARTMVAKANAATAIAQEQQKIAEFNVGEAQKQVDAINAQIAAKKAEIAKKDEFFEQIKDFAGGMKDSVMTLGELAFKGEGDTAPASATQLSTGDILSLGFKVGTASNVLGTGAQALGGAAGVAGPFGAFLYAGVTSMQSMADAISKRAGDLAQLQNVALPAAKALVDLKKRDVTIAQLSQVIAQADAKLGTDLLVYYAQRFINRSFLISMAEFSNRLMRRYLDLAGRTAWLAERALAFEQDRDLSIITFDYFPRARLGVSGADILQLHLAELEAARIQGLTQTIPVKQTISLARDFPVQFGQLKKTGTCTFATSETPLRLVYPGVYGYRVRNVTIAATYAAAIQPHRGLFSNQGVSLVTRDKAGTAHTLVRYPDALPLSEFRMREDMWVFDLPDETLLPFEGCGIETMWELALSKIGNANGFDTMTDLLITFDIRASYSAFLREEHIAALPASANRSLLVSGNASNPGALTKFRAHGGKVTLAFDLAKAARNTNESARKTLNFVLIAVGADDAVFNSKFSSTIPASTSTITFEKGIALSNAGVLADGNGGVPLPLNAFTGLSTDQIFKLEIDTAIAPGINFKNLREVMLLVEYEAAF